MFKWFRRSGHSNEAEVPFESRITEARMEQRFGAFMDSDRAEGEGNIESAESTEYIQAAVEPSEELWEHEKELYRKKQEEESG
jgi:hypothetical protein